MRFFARKSERLAAAFAAWAPVAVAATGCALIVYGAMLQTIRFGANDPQDAMAEDAADALSSGAPLPPQPDRTTDVGSSLLPFVAYYGADGAPISSSGLLDGDIPVPPKGMLEAAKRTGENRVTWQPAPGVRIAAVVVPVAPGKGAAYVLAGRSLRETGRAISRIGNDVLFGWAVTMLGSFAAAAAAVRRKEA